MRHFILALVAAGILAVAAFSGLGQATVDRSATTLMIQSESRNPWTSTTLNNDPEEFQFAIVSDRTGGHRSKVFSQAVERLNLMQPEFVLSVGDLIEGGNKSQKQLAAEWEEFDGYISHLKMPFFYVPGNHDVGTQVTDDVWGQKYGRRHYHFTYRNVLFLCLNTEDPPGSGPGNLGQEQVEYAKKVLADNRNVRWTIVAMHKPIWTAANLEKRGWLEVEKALLDRPYTVFVGHIHHYQKFVRNGRNYYQLATTGGSSKMRGIREGEFDHIVWVTMKKSGPVLANILVDAVLPENLRTPESAEQGVSTANRLPTHPVRGKAFIDGAPATQAYVVLQAVEGKTKRSVRADGWVDADGAFTLSTYKANDGVPAGEYAALVTLRTPVLTPQGRPGPNQFPARYASADTSPLRVKISPDQKNDVVLELQK